ncbi:Inner membrane protein yiaA [Shigella sonnei]|nr:Inner membrane protein yiaA [Shigella sonnei]
MRHYYSVKKVFMDSLFGAVAVQKNIRDAGINPPKETQVTQEEYSE